MKKNNIIIAMGMASMMLAAPALANNTGKVTFVGEIVASSCSVHPDSVDQTVNMGQISTKQLENQGESAARPFSIKLENCEAGKAVTAKFTGASLSTQKNLLVLGGGQAGGAGIQLYHGDGKAVELGVAGAPLSINKGSNQLDFSATLKGHDGVTATAGRFTATTNFELAYN